MIPTATDVKIEGSLPGEDVQMTLDSNSLAHLMTVLSNLYSNKPLAVVREYSTNARDSHIEAGVDRPIEISTPTDFMPFLKIRDYGVGMDAETIRNVYSKYGASTKRETNLQNGMLGLGSKSALTYTTQFNITGIKNGIKTYVVVSRAADGSGVMKIISQSQTDEPNGVEISIPVSNRVEIDNVVYGFFRFWKPGTVLINGKEPAKVQGMEVGKFLVISEQKDYVVMGNVAYPVPQEHRIFSGNFYSRTGVVAYVEMGEVNFTPSRESLHMTDLTKSTLKRLSKEFDAEAKKYLTDKISNAKSHTEALKEYYELQRSNLSMYVNNLSYKGEKFPTMFDFPWVSMIDSGHTYKARRTDAHGLFSRNSVIVYGYEYENVHSTHRTKIRLWMESQNNDSQFVYWCKEVPGSPWTDEVTQVHWDDVRKMKIVRQKTTPTKQVLFDKIDHRGYRISDNAVDTTKDVTFVSPAEIASQEMKENVARFLLFDSNAQVLLVNKNKWKQFQEDYPQAMHLQDRVKLVLADYLANLTHEEKIYLRSDWKDRSFCARLDESKVLDPDIKAAIRTLTSNGLSKDTEKKYEAASRIAHKWGIAFPDLSNNGERLFRGYPLLDVYSYSGADHYPLSQVYLYMNTCYKENLVNP
jgi:hypothetical protein